MPSFKEFIEDRPELKSLPKNEQHLEYDLYIHNILENMQD